MRRLAEDVAGRAAFHETTEVHDGKALANLLHHRKIMTDQ